MVNAETLPKRLNQILMSCFIHVESISRKKNPVLPIEKLPFLELARNTIMLQHLIDLIIHFSLHYLSRGRLRVVKNKTKSQNVLL